MQTNVHSTVCLLILIILSYSQSCKQNGHCNWNTWSSIDSNRHLKWIEILWIRIKLTSVSIPSPVISVDSSQFSKKNTQKKTQMLCFRLCDSFKCHAYLLYITILKKIQKPGYVWEWRMSSSSNFLLCDTGQFSCRCSWDWKSTPLSPETVNRIPFGSLAMLGPAFPIRT